MARHRNNYENLWSSDDSEDDDYNYLKALDNINWNSCRQDSGQSNAFRPTERRNVAKNGSKPASRVRHNPTAKPAVAVKVKTNRNDVLLKDIMASEKDKTKDMAKSETNCDNKKREFDLMDVNDDIDDIVITEDNYLKPNGNSDKSDNNSLPKNKRPKVDNINDSEYDIKIVLNQKKANHEKIVTNNNKNSDKSAINRVKNERLFGKAFSPTVYSPEVPVMSKTTVPQTCNIQIIQKALTFNEESGASEESRYSQNAILSIILDWNTKWLQECNQTEVPNILNPFGEGIGLKTCYDSLEEYQSAYIPLILFEAWAQILKDFTNEKHFDFDAMRGQEVNSDERFMKITLQTVVPKNRVHMYPSEGYLLLLELMIDYSASNEKRKVILFSYVKDFRADKITKSTTLPPGIAEPPSHTNPQILRYVVVMTKKPIRLSQNQVIKVKAIHYLKPTLRQIDLISSLHSSPLFKDILKPRLFTCQVVVPTTGTSTTPNFNDSQNRAIIGSSEALSRPYAVPKVLFIQGPPGTGKTHTLIGIIKHIYLHWDKEDRLPRILICAPSNGAVDEVSRRLYRERHFLVKHKVGKHKRALRCVRVGKESQIHPDARNILFESLIKENSDTEKRRLNELKEKKTKDLERKMQKLDQEIANLRANKKKEELAVAEKEAHLLMFEMQKISNNSNPEEKCSKGRLKLDIMCKADIVLSTLNSCHSAPIERLYQQYGPKTFDCVIVDEASQCSEPELLMPLAYKMTKMILIGDPMQLPATIISKKASSLLLGRSLFERFYHYFRQCELTDPLQVSPILMLTEQYRMHPQICQFPSTHFYDGRLTSSTKVIKCREFKLKPYIVFDVTDSIENRADPTSKYNELEAKFVIRLISLIDQMLESVALSLKTGNSSERHKFSVGIITPYNGQKSYLNNKLNDRTFKNLNLDVNTVDGFQGQERDIIILSAVRAFDNQNNSNKWQSIGFLDSVQRMNVALTRAKYSMILCISGRSLETNKNWKSLIEDAMRRVNSRFKVPSTLADDKLMKMLAVIETISIAD